MRLGVAPVSDTLGIPRPVSSRSISRSMLVNWENTRIRRPSAVWVRTSSTSASSLADFSTRLAASTATSRGSQHTCRSFISASSTVTVDAPSPFFLIIWRTLACAATRMLSYSSRCSPLSATGRTISVLGGSSFTTSLFMRRRMNGATRFFSISIADSLPCSMGVRNRRRNCSALPSRLGMRKRNMLHSSPRLFSTGVPDRQIRRRASSADTAR